MPNFGRALILAGMLLGRLGFAAVGRLTSLIRQRLSQSPVIALTQVRDGYLWLETFDGLSRFDGNRFRVFTEWNTPGWNGSKILHLSADNRSGLSVDIGKE